MRWSVFSRHHVSILNSHEALWWTSWWMWSAHRNNFRLFVITFDNSRHPGLIKAKVKSGESSDFWRMMKWRDSGIDSTSSKHSNVNQAAKSDLLETRRSWTLNRVYSWEILDVKLKINLNISTSKWKLAWKSLDSRSTTKMLHCTEISFFSVLPKLTKLLETQLNYFFVAYSITNDYRQLNRSNSWALQKLGR